MFHQRGVFNRIAGVAMVLVIAGSQWTCSAWAQPPRAPGVVVEGAPGPAIAPPNAADQARLYHERMAAGNDAQAWDCVASLVQYYPQDPLTKLTTSHWAKHLGEGAEDVSIVNYRVTDMVRLVEENVAGPNGVPLTAQSVGQGNQQEYLRGLASILRHATPGIWRDDMGRTIGHLSTVEAGPEWAFIISQTASGHEMIVDMLGKLQAISKIRIALRIRVIESPRPLAPGEDRDFSAKEIPAPELAQLPQPSAGNLGIMELSAVNLMSRGTATLKVLNYLTGPPMQQAKFSSQVTQSLSLRAQLSPDRARVQLMVALYEPNPQEDVLRSVVSEEIAIDSGLLIPISTFQVGPGILDRALLRSEGISLPEEEGEFFRYLLICPYVSGVEVPPPAAPVLEAPEPPPLPAN